jgi:hypothetical protein
MVCSLVPVENHKDGCIHNMATTKMNYEIEFHVLGKKLNSLLNCQNVLGTAPIDAPWSLYWNGCLSELGSDLYGTGSGPLGGLRPSLDTECAPKDSTVRIGCYMAQNDRLVK